MTNNSREMIRVNTRISKTSNEWLNAYSVETGLPKSTIIMIAIENFIREKEVMDRMADMGDIVKKLDDLKIEIEKLKLSESARKGQA